MHLTSEGKRLIRRIFAEHERNLERAASVLSLSERATLVRLLKKLGLDAQRALGEMAEPEPLRESGERN